MAENERPPERDVLAKPGARDRTARLAAAMRANLQRRKRQRRARELPSDADGDAGKPVEQGRPIT